MAIREKGERRGRPYLGGHRNCGAEMLEETIASFDHNLPLFTARLPNTGLSILGSQQAGSIIRRFLDGTMPLCFAED